MWIYTKLIIVENQNIEQLSEQLRQTKKEKNKSGKQIGAFPHKVEVKHNISESDDIQGKNCRNILGFKTLICKISHSHLDWAQLKYDSKVKLVWGKDDWENMINQAYNKEFVSESDQASYLKSWEDKGSKAVTIMNVLSTKGDSSSNWATTIDRKYSSTNETKSNSMSRGSDERNAQKQSIKPSKDVVELGKIFWNFD